MTVIFFCIVMTHWLILDFPSLIFLVGVFFFYSCHLHSFLKNSRSCNVSNFSIVSNLFASMAIITLVWLIRNTFPCQTSFPSNSVFLLSQKTSFPTEPVLEVEVLLIFNVVLRHLLTIFCCRSLYNKMLPKSFLKSGSAPGNLLFIFLCTY